MKKRKFRYECNILFKKDQQEMSINQRHWQAIQSSTTEFMLVKGYRYGYRYRYIYTVGTKGQLETVCTHQNLNKVQVLDHDPTDTYNNARTTTHNAANLWWWWTARFEVKNKCRCTLYFHNLCVQTWKRKKHSNEQKADSLRPGNQGMVFI